MIRKKNTYRVHYQLKRNAKNPTDDILQSPEIDTAATDDVVIETISVLTQFHMWIEERPFPVSRIVGVRLVRERW